MSWPIPMTDDAVISSHVSEEFFHQMTQENAHYRLTENSVIQAMDSMIHFFLK